MPTPNDSASSDTAGTSTKAVTETLLAPRNLAPFQLRALWTVIAIALLTCGLMPVASEQWPAIPAFLPAYHTFTVGTYCIAAYLLYGYFRQTGARSLLW